jgi:hypothetical protein
MRSNICLFLLKSLSSFAIRGSSQSALSQALVLQKLELSEQSFLLFNLA